MNSPVVTGWSMGFDWQEDGVRKVIICRRPDASVSSGSPPCMNYKLLSTWIAVTAPRPVAGQSFLQVSSYCFLALHSSTAIRHCSMAPTRRCFSAGLMSKTSVQQWNSAWPISHVSERSPVGRTDLSIEMESRNLVSVLLNIKAVPFSSNASYRIAPDEFCILSCEEGRGRRLGPFLQQRRESHDGLKWVQTHPT